MDKLEGILELLGSVGDMPETPKGHQGPLEGVHSAQPKDAEEALCVIMDIIKQFFGDDMPEKGMDKKDKKDMMDKMDKPDMLDDGEME